MPQWKLTLAIVLALIGGTCTQNRPMVLLDGVSFSKSVDGLRLEFDGDDLIAVRRGTQHLMISARTPANLVLSPTNRRLALNFGSGSGQVLDFEVYDLLTMEKIAVHIFKNRILQKARAGKCPINADEISYVVTSWEDDDMLRVKTENWSRRLTCPTLDRHWVVNLPMG